MATIGYLRLLFGADTSPLKKGCKEARSAIASVGDAGSALGGKMIALTSSLAAAAGVAGLGAWVKSSMNGIDAAHDLAERVGTSVEALTKLQYAAQFSGVDADTLAGSLEKMQIRLGQVAQTGGGKAADALARFGVSAGDLAKGDAIDSFHAILDVLGKIQNPADRAAAAVDLFGKSGVGMINMVAQGADGIRAFEDEAVKVGAVFDDIDAEKVGEANDSIDRLKAALQGVGDTLAIKLAPWITIAADKILELTTNGIDMGFSLSGAWEMVRSAVMTVDDAYNLLVDEGKLVSAGIDYIGVGVLKAFGTLVDGGRLVSAGIDHIGVAFLEAGKMGLKVFGWLGKGVGLFVDQLLEELQAAASYMEDWLDVLTRPIVDLLKALRVLPKAFTVNLVSPLIQAGRSVASRAGGAMSGVTEGWIGQLDKAGESLKAAAATDVAGIGSGIFVDAAADLRDAAQAELASIGSSKGVGASTLLDNVEGFAGNLWNDAQAAYNGVIDEANGRAAQAVDKSKKFRGGGEDLDGVEKDHKFAGALDIDSKEARSAILTARGLSGGDKVGQQTAANTAKTAEAAGRTATLLSDIKAAMGGGDMIDLLESV